MTDAFIVVIMKCFIGGLKVKTKRRNLFLNNCEESRRMLSSRLL